MTVSVMSPDLIASHGLTTDEYDRIVAIIGREPNLVELGMFGAMWSEHCSYKSSRVHLATLPTEGPRILQGPGENAGWGSSSSRASRSGLDFCSGRRAPLTRP